MCLKVHLLIKSISWVNITSNEYFLKLILGSSNDIASLGASAGDRLPNIAEEQMAVGLSVAFDVMSAPAFARLDMSYYGDSFATFKMSDEDMSPSYTQLNLNVGVDLDEQSRLQLSINNLTDVRTEAFRFSAESLVLSPPEQLIGPWSIFCSIPTCQTE